MNNENLLNGDNSNGLWGRFLSKRVQFALDVLVLVGAFIYAYLLRFDFAVPGYLIRPMLIQLPCVVVLQLVALYLSGVHSFVWRYVGISEVRAFFIAAASVFVIMVGVRLGLPTSMSATW